MADLNHLLRIEPFFVSGFSALKFLELLQIQHLKLCDVLEEIADCLPDRADERQCTYATAVLRQCASTRKHLEEEVLFPRLMARADNAPALHRILERLADEHRTDEGHGEEAIELLSTLAKGVVPVNVEAAGYMLRGLFEGLRRHIAFENDHVLPLAQSILLPEDLEALARAIRRIG